MPAAAPGGMLSGVLPFLRIWLPAVVTLVGVAVMVLGGGDDVSLEGGAGIIGAGLAIWLMNVLFRVGLGNDRDRDEEDAARDFYDAHGHWPDEQPPPAAPPPAHVTSAAKHPRPHGDGRALRPRRPG